MLCAVLYAMPTEYRTLSNTFEASPSPNGIPCMERRHSGRRSILESGDRPVYGTQRVARESAVKRLVQAEEVAELAVYLCSPEAALINGASLCIDGGWTAH
jgi:NAD(P)-dependent dehydrogenase (short-subunit alcohol dehydrogenase family)